MINRPSYAQRTLELTRHSLQHMPATLTPAVSGVIVVATAAPADDTATLRTAAGCTRSSGVLSLQRWRRKGAVDPRMAVR
jgi:hypothetical protein